MKKILKKFLIVSGSILFIYTSYLAACSFELPELFRMFDPELSQPGVYRPFLRIHQAIHNRGEQRDTINAVEWQKFLETKIPADKFFYFIYKTKPEDIRAIITYRENSSRIISRNLKNINDLLSGSKHAGEFLSYLEYAKRCEVISSYEASWEDYDDKGNLIKERNPRYNRELVSGLLKEGLTILNTQKKGFIRQRYLFQVGRLYYYAREFNTCYYFYNKYINEFDEGITRYRFMGFAAGSLYGLKQYAEANYLYSLIYDQCDPMKVVCLNSFKPVEESDWKECLKLASSVREKEVLWQMMGIYKDPFRGMKEIYSLDPGSELINLLLVRYLNIMEEQVWTDGYSPDKNVSYAPSANIVSDEEAEFITYVSSRQNTNKPLLWDLAAAYIQTIKGDFKKAGELLSAFEKRNLSDQIIVNQFRTIRLIMSIESAPVIDSAVEEKIGAEFQYIDMNTTQGYDFYDVTDWFRNRLSEKYYKQGDVVKAELFNPEGAAFYDRPDNVRAMVTYMDNPEKSSFDSLALKLYKYDRLAVFDYLAVKKYFEDDLASALMLYREGEKNMHLQVGRAVKNTNWNTGISVYVPQEYYINGNTNLKGDPFLIHINDCHDCDHAAYQQRKYNKKHFLEEMIRLRALTDKNPASHAQESFLLATGYYNASFWGNARTFYQTEILTYGDSGFEYAYDMEERRKLPIYEYSRAAFYYKLAYDNSADPEFKAKCIFMLAKCEHNEFIMNKPENYIGDFMSGKYFRLLKNSWSNTKYYKEIIKECGYFRTYVTR